MSQKKVDQYKKEKANRKQHMKKEKIARITYSIVGIVIAAAIVSWAGYSIYARSNGTDAANGSSTVEVDTSALDSYLSNLGSD